MTSPSPPLHYTIGEPVYEGHGTAVYRAVRNADGQPVLLKVLDPRSCRPKDLDRLKREYETGKMLDVGTIVRPLALEMYEGMLALVMEDSGAAPLDRLLGAPMETGRFLELAVRIAGAVSDIHQRGVVHRDLKPANILVNSTGEVKIADLGLASRLPREPQAAQPAHLIEGSLPYMSPEQTGRMNRGIDSRSDLYSLGVTFYQMLTGKLPFQARDPLEWIHCHVAREFAAPSDVVPEVPEAIERIVIKLLAKMPEERYQTARGLRYDLERCFERWSSRGRIEPFPLGEQDVSDRLQIPQTLYGRDEEIAVLLRAFEHVVDTGTPQLVLISGYSGIGKSTLVHELHKPVVRERGFFASGKFDQYKRDIPYSTIVQALQEIVLEILADSGGLAAWKQRLLGALTINAQLIVDLIPRLELVIGRPPPAPELPPAEAQNRFRIVFRHFIGVFARKEHPLALFLDDLHWADSASLRLLEDLMTHPETRHLLVIGAYRDNEVPPSHPLMLMLDKVRKEGVRASDIVLGPLSSGQLAMLVSDTLHCRLEDAAPLSELVHEKTAGNPFFAIQFITALHEEHLIGFDGHAGVWQWDVARIREKGFTDNVIDLMVHKLVRLPASTQSALKQLAGLGNTAEVAVFTIAYGRSEEESHADLWEAVRAGLVLRRGGVYKFLHDRVQEAAYSLIPESERAGVHLQIGRLLSSRTPPEELEEKIFEIVNQLDRGAALVTSREERERVAELNLVAGKRAKRSIACASALTYLSVGTELLAEDSWARRYELTFALELHRAECEYLTGALSAAEKRLSMLSHRARNLVDIAAVTSARVALYTTLDRSDRGVEVCLEYLRRVGVKWSPHPTDEEVQAEYKQIWHQLGSRPIEELIDLPPATDPDCHATMDVLTWSQSPALFTDEKLVCLVIGRMANISLEHGNSDGSCLGYIWLGRVLGPCFGDYRAGFRFGKLGFDLFEKRGVVRCKARVYLSFALLIPWARHMRTGLDLLRRAFDAAQETGELTYACYTCNCLITRLLAQGDPLGEVQREAERALEFVRNAKFGLIVDIITGQLRLIRTLRGLLPDFSSFNDAQFDEGRFEQHLESDPRLSIATCWYWIRKLQARFLAGDYLSAVAAAAKAQPLLWTSPSFFELAEYHFHGALARAARYDAASVEERAVHREALVAHHKQLEVWADNCPENFMNRYALASAEVARIEGRSLDAERLYEEAIRSARDNGFVHNEALAYELASRFYRARGFDKFADTYLREARSCYVRWGADGKVKQLERLYPQLLERRPLAPNTTFAARAEHLDLLSAVKASQTISGEILFEKLLRTLLEVVLEQGGAQKGCLILVRDDDLAIEAEAAIEERQRTVTKVLHSLPVSSSPLVPASLLHYVRLTRERVILDDAAAKAGRFSGDEYIVRNKPRSVLCVPVLRQAEVTALLYLENNLTTHAFTPERLLALELLATQAAISLENALLLAREREARAAAEAAERRTAFLAHELKTPLTGLHLKLDALTRSIKHQETVSSSWLSPSLMSFKRQLGRLSLLIDSLLDLSRVQMGRLVLTREPVDLTALVRDVAGRLSEQAELAGCELHVQATGAIWGQWDRLRLEQVATNLLTNALKYGGGKPVRIVADADGAAARLSVLDQGIGIPEPDQQRVFEAFERATGLYQAQSLGLGLYLVRELVRAHGGRVHLHSRPGSGTTFVVELPIEPGGEISLAQPS
ncbi:AAA family ATPase [Sorangium sp. So ce1128]